MRGSVERIAAAVGRPQPPRGARHSHVEHRIVAKPHALESQHRGSRQAAAHLHRPHDVGRGIRDPEPSLPDLHDGTGRPCATNV